MESLFLFRGLNNLFSTMPSPLCADSSVAMACLNKWNGMKLIARSLDDGLSFVSVGTHDLEEKIIIIITSPTTILHHMPFLYMTW